VSAPLGPTQHRLCLMGDGWWREIRLVVSRNAAVVPEAKSRMPATGLATVPTIPLPTPNKNPYVSGRRMYTRAYPDSCVRAEEDIHRY